MMPVNEAINTAEYTRLKVLMYGLGFVLDEEQLHIGGERSIMSLHKLVLTGADSRDGARVVIKVSLDDVGAADILHEHRVRETLAHVTFADDELSFPPERYFGIVGDTTISVTEFIAQDKIFVAHTLREQFFMALRWFESQEAFHATTYEHERSLKATFAFWSSKEYIADVRGIQTQIASLPGEHRSVITTLKKLESALHTHAPLIDRLSGFLNHTDLVPHNFRIKNGTLYALDQVSIWFGNKYEVWARFINYMLIHNPALAEMLVRYVKDERGEDGSTALRLMRAYKAAVLIRYYARAMNTTDGDLHILSQTRYTLWTTVLEALLDNRDIDADALEAYRAVRDSLRSEEEKKRQREFAKA